MRILILAGAYPRSDDLYANAFIHVRAKEYQRLGHEVTVVAFFVGHDAYVYEGITVVCASNLDGLTRLIAQNAPDVIALHFFQGWMLRKLIEGSTVPFVIWVHGTDATAWTFRLFRFALTKDYAHYVFFNTLQMVRFRKLVSYAKSQPGRLRFVFISEWLHRTACRSIGTSIGNYSVIANPIDTRLFRFIPKTPDQRFRVLLIRPFTSPKYANDVAVDAIRILSSTQAFTRFHFLICGAGPEFETTTSPLAGFANVEVRNGFLNHEEIAKLHGEYGVFLCPTRQDSQGVSMCEAMASGLVPLASKSSGIPEFVTDGRSGFLTGSSGELADAMVKLSEEPSLFQSMSAEAAAEIREKCSIEPVVAREILTLESAVVSFAEAKRQPSAIAS